MSAEHTVIEIEIPELELRIGDKLEFVVVYADMTVNLHELLFGVRAGVVEVAWPIAARGKVN